jgi:hypothetical protein
MLSRQHLVFDAIISRSVASMFPRDSTCARFNTDYTVIVKATKVITRSFYSTKSNSHQDDGSQNMC